jgi:putative inorganic carbon (hco3(-)) transporter
MTMRGKAGTVSMMNALGQPATWRSPLRTGVVMARDVVNRQAWPKVFAYTLALYIAVVVGRIHESIPGLAALYPGKIAGALLIGACLGQRSKIRFGGAFKTTTVRCLAVITVLAVLSVATSYWPKASVDFLTNQWPLVVLMAITVIAGFADQRTAVLGIGAFTIAAGIGAIQLLLGAGLSDAGRLYIGSGGSTTYDPNYSAAFFVMALPYAVMFAARPGWMRWIALPITPCLAVAIINTGSRGGVVALGVVVLSLILLANRKHRTKYFIVIAAGVGALTLVPHSQLSQRFEDVSNGTDYNFSSRDGRMEVWRRGIGMMESRPVTGVGLRAYEAADGLISGSYTDAHNAFIQIAAELGVGGLVAFVAAIVASFRLGVRRRSKLSKPASGVAENDRALGAALVTAALCALIADVASDMFLSMAYEAMTLFAIAVPCGLALSMVRGGSPSNGRVARRNPSPAVRRGLPAHSSPPPSVRP